MARKQNTVQAWEPNVKQERAALLHAQGNPWLQIADEIQVNYSTLQRWQDIPEFMELVHWYEDHINGLYLRRYARLINTALTLEQQVLDGEVPADDPRAVRAHQILSKTAYPVSVARANAVDRGLTGRDAAGAGGESRPQLHSPGAA